MTRSKSFVGLALISVALSTTACENKQLPRAEQEEFFLLMTQFLCDNREECGLELEDKCDPPHRFSFFDNGTNSCAAYEQGHAECVDAIDAWYLAPYCVEMDWQFAGCNTVTRCVPTE